MWDLGNLGSKQRNTVLFVQVFSKSKIMSKLFFFLSIKKWDCCRTSLHCWITNVVLFLLWIPYWGWGRKDEVLCPFLGSGPGSTALGKLALSLKGHQAVLFLTHPISSRLRSQKNLETPATASPHPLPGAWATDPPGCGPTLWCH